MREIIISGYLSSQLKDLLEKDDSLKFTKSQGIIPLLNYTEKYEKGFYNPENLFTVDKVRVDGDIYLVDFFEELRGFIGILGGKIVESVYVEEKNKKNIKKVRITKIKSITIPNREKEEALRVFLNHILRSAPKTKIILINLVINDKYRIINGEKQIFNDKQKAIVMQLNKYLSFYIDSAKRINNSINVLDVDVFLSDVANEIVFNDSAKEIIQNIKNVEKYNKGFKGEDVYLSEAPIKFYYEKASKLNEDKLLVIFSAFSYDSAKYNYISTLKKVDCNKLFILDDYGGRGCYYLGLNGEFNIESSVMSLITNKMAELDIKFKDVIMAGSSKGGSAALYFGLKYNVGNIIAGAPQYMIGTYLCQLTVKEHAEKIFGEISEATRIKYDNLIKFAASTNNKSKIKIVTGEGDTQYKRVLKAFEYIAKEYNLDLTMTMSDIKSHSEISKIFPMYLVDNLRGILEQKQFNSRDIGNNISSIFKIYKSN